MDLYVLNTNFEKVAIIDSYESLVWTDRFREPGDFELYCFPEAKLLADCQVDYYLENTESEHLMFIETQKITTDVDDGDRFILTGESLESILRRRVIWKEKSTNGTIQEVVEGLLNDAIISPELEERKIPNFVFDHNADPIVEGISIVKEFKIGDDLYEMINKICEENNVGFKITLSEDKKFHFMLYAGVDRSYDQNDVPYVIFSSEYDNVITSEYSYSKSEYKNICLITANDKDNNEKVKFAGEYEGLMRREMHIDGSDVPTKNSMDQDYSTSDFEAMLVGRAKKELISYEPKETFEGEVDASSIFVYDEDFFLGDILQVANAYGMEGPALVKEIIWSYDKSGHSCYPTFEAKSNGEDDVLFYNGNQYRAVTGGWGIYDPNPETEEPAKYELSTGTTIYFKSEESKMIRNAFVITNNMIDLTPYGKIRFEIIGYGKACISGEDKSKALATVWINMQMNGTAELDVSDINQKCHIMFTSGGIPTHVEVYKVSLIK